MKRRSGVTLVEVLVAIFIMGIGLLALLTLFPIGMLRMAQAIRDARSAQSGNNAHKLAMIQDVRNDPLVFSTNGAPDTYNNGFPISNLFLNPCPNYPGPPPIQLPNANVYGESYSVLVDPIGYGVSSVPARDWVGGLAPYLRRRPVGFAVGANLYRNFTLPDDINFNGDLSVGSPGTPQISGVAVLRETRFSWAYHFRRPLTGDPTVVDCTVVVFDQRSLLSLEEYVYPNQTYFNPTNNTISIDYTTNVPPPLRIGDWIYDATLNNAVRTTPCAAHGYFYRVVSIEEFVVAGKTIARYEVQNPLRGFQDPGNAATPMTDPTFGYLGTSIVIRGIAEVFEKGPVRIP